MDLLCATERERERGRSSVFFQQIGIQQLLYQSSSAIVWMDCKDVLQMFLWWKCIVVARSKPPNIHLQSGFAAPSLEIRGMPSTMAEALAASNLPLSPRRSKAWPGRLEFTCVDPCTPSMMGSVRHSRCRGRFRNRSLQ